MASNHFEWAPFCQQMNWDFNKTVAFFPVGLWVKKKLDEFEMIRADKLRSAIFRARGEYEDRVVEALTNLPKVADLAHGIYIEAARDFIGRQKSSNPKDKPTPAEVKIMVEAAEKVIDMKQKSLLINKFSVDILRRDVLTPPPAQSASGEASENNPNALAIEIVGIESSGPVTPQQMTKLMMTYMDQAKPQTEVADNPEEPQDQDQNPEVE
jgi:hypothetical protein